MFTLGLILVLTIEWAFTGTANPVLVRLLIPTIIIDAILLAAVG